MEPSNTDINDYKSPFQLTKSIHKDLYPALDPNNPDLSASGKVVMITCAEGRIGSVSASQISFYIIKTLLLPSCCDDLGNPPYIDFLH